MAQYLVAKKLEVHFSLPGRSREARPMRPVHHRDDPTLTANRLVSGDLVHFESFKRGRNVVLSDVVWRGVLGGIVGHILRQSRWQILRHVAMVVGIDTGLAALYQNVPASIRTGNVGGLIKK